MNPIEALSPRRTTPSVLLVALLIPLLASACSSRLEPVAKLDKPPAPTVVAPTKAAPPPLLALGPGDAVSLQVYGRPELTVTSYVADDGTLSVPLAGAVEVQGLSPAEGASRIASAYEKKRLLVNPQVTLFLVESRSQQVSVLGAVRAPGRYGVTSRSTVFDVIALAGGIDEAGGSQVVVMRNEESGVKRYPVDLGGLSSGRTDVPTLQLRGGDSVFVPPAAQFSIYGEVNTPSLYRLEPGMTVVEAISLSGGLTPRGSRNRIEIRRRLPDGGYSTGDASLNDRIEPDDVIRIKERLF